MIYKGVPFHERAERKLRETVKREGLELIDNRAVYCYDEWFSNGGDCGPWYSVCLAYAKKRDSDRERSYRYEDYVVEIKPLENVTQVIVKVYDR